MKERFQHLNQDEINTAFFNACQQNFEKEAKYLLTSTDLINKADINFKDDCGLIWVCRNENFNLMKFFLTSEELTSHANIHAQNDKVFTYSLNQEELGNKFYKKVLEYLVNEYKIDMTPEIENLLDFNLYQRRYIGEDRKEWLTHIRKTVEDNTLHLNLQKNLSINEKISPKIKV